MVCHDEANEQATEYKNCTESCERVIFRPIFGSGPESNYLESLCGTIFQYYFPVEVCCVVQLVLCRVHHTLEHFFLKQHAPAHPTNKR